MAPITLPIIHFNDVYRVRQKDKTGRIIGADQFAAKIQSIRQTWGEPQDLANLPPPSIDPTTNRQDWSQHATARQRKGLVLFSGDLFSPSVESSVTRGTHLVPVINAMNLDCACLGNHDWDFGYPHLQTLMSQTNFPWLFSNVVDVSSQSESQKQAWDEDPKDQDKQVQGTLQSWTTIVQGVKVGFIGIVEKEWIATVPSFPPEFVYRNMVKAALRLSRQLRDPNGEACELIIAITHSRLPNDIDFANQVGAVTSTDPNSHGVDLVLGGHDHIYYIGNGASSFKGDEFPKGEPGTEKDTNAMVVKSGTDFRNLSELKLELTDRDDTKVRKRTINKMSVERHCTSPDDPTSPELEKMLDELLAKISQSTGQAVAHTLTPWDARSEKVRTDESALGDFIADVLMCSYEEVLRERDNRGELEESRPQDVREVDCSLICGGSLRGDSVYGPGKVALSDVLEILPFEDAVVCKELKGQDIWDALENGLSMYPKQEGRFPQVAGLQVKWDSRKPPGNRLVSVDLLDNPLDMSSGDANALQPISHDRVGKVRQYNVLERSASGYNVEVHLPALRVKAPLEMDKTYRVVTREYLAEGYDGFEALTRGRFIIDHENGQLMSAIVRKFLLGANYIWRMEQIRKINTTDSSAAAAAAAKVDASEAKKSDGIDRTVDVNDGSETKPQTMSKRTRQALLRARSLAMLHRSASYNPEYLTTPRKEDGPFRHIIDQSHGGFRDCLHVGGAEHHSEFDSVHKELASPNAAQASFLARSKSEAGVPSLFTFSPLPKRVKLSNHHSHRRSIDETPLDLDLFDPEYAPKLLQRIRTLCSLISQASLDSHSLFKPSDKASSTDPTQNVSAAGDMETFDGPNIALGATADVDSEDPISFDASQPRLHAQPTELTQSLVREAKALQLAFGKLNQAAESLPGGEMNLVEQQQLLGQLETYLTKQNDLQSVLMDQTDHIVHPTVSFDSDSIKTEHPTTVSALTHSIKVEYQEVEEMKDADDQLAVISPLIDGRLIDLARVS